MAPLLEVKHLKKYFPTNKGIVHAVDDVTFGLDAGRTMGVVGESGCGKSTLGRTIIHLQESTDGQIIFDGKDVTHVKGKALNALRGDMQIVFQDPYSSLNPRMSVADTIMEPLLLSKRFKKGPELEKEANRLMDMVGIESRLRNAYPHEMDGGRRQRVGIGRALALSPRFIVCDEPISALDVSIQAQIINILEELQAKYGFTYLFISHDLAMVRHISSQIGVMYLGDLLEYGQADEVYTHMLHPYTKALISAEPIADPDLAAASQRIVLEGDVSSPIDPKDECRFCSRCQYAEDVCRQSRPRLKKVNDSHYVACHLV